MALSQRFGCEPFRKYQAKSPKSDLAGNSQKSSRYQALPCYHKLKLKEIVALAFLVIWNTLFEWKSLNWFVSGMERVLENSERNTGKKLKKLQKFINILKVSNIMPRNF